MSSEIGVADIKRRFSEFLNRVELNRERVVIQRRGRRVAALVPADEIDAVGGLVDRPTPRGLLAAAGVWEDFDEADEFLEEIRRLRDQSSDRSVEPLE